MKKTFRQTDRLKHGRRRLQAFAIALLIAASVVGFAAHQLSASQNYNSELAAFDNAHQSRSQQLKRLFSHRAEALGVIAAALSELPDISNTFNETLDPVVETSGFQLLCWHEPDNNLQLQSPAHSSGCEHFEFFQYAKLVPGEQPLLFLSVISGGLERANAGFVSAAIDLSSLLQPSSPTANLEYIVINDHDLRSTIRYEISAEGLRLAPDEHAEPPLRRKLSDLVELPGVSITHDHRLLPQTSPVPLLIGVCAALATLIIGGVGCFAWWKTQILDQQVSRRTEELEQFAYRASHGLKSPLTSIHKLSEIALLDLDRGETEEVKGMLEHVRSQAGSLRNLVSELFDLSKAENAISNDQPLDLAEIIDNIRARHTGTATDANMRIEIDLADPLPSRGPHTRVAQILDNLFANALKYADPTQTPPRVRVAASCQGRTLTLTVEDNGIGFPPAFYAQDDIVAFKRYHPERAIGSGIGLSIVMRHVGRLGGAVRFEALSPGNRIEVEIPGMPT